jgi:hypothetical protein
MSKAAELAALIGSGQAQGNKNLIINGAMQVAQRGTSAVAAGAGTYPSIDRFKAWESTDGAFTVEQSTTAPAGFTTSFNTNSQVNWMDSTSNNFYLTGVQLEIGDVATAFEHEDVGTTLRKCKRYYELLNTSVYPNAYSTAGLGMIFWTEQKRATPTITSDTNSGSYTLNAVSTSGGYMYIDSYNGSSIGNVRGAAEL